MSLLLKISSLIIFLVLAPLSLFAEEQEVQMGHCSFQLMGHEAREEMATFERFQIGVEPIHRGLEVMDDARGDRVYRVAYDPETLSYVERTTAESLLLYGAIHSVAEYDFNTTGFQEASEQYGKYSYADPRVRIDTESLKTKEETRHYAGVLDRNGSHYVYVFPMPDVCREIFMRCFGIASDELQPFRICEGEAEVKQAEPKPAPAPQAEEPRDSDQDGVMDDADLCPDTPPGTPVDETGCPILQDSDRDGVFDDKDQCPDTPQGFQVDGVGCKESYQFEAYFDFDQDVLKMESMDSIQRFVDFMQSNPGYHAEIQGHTDSDGSEYYNLDLSERRANAVMNALIQRGVDVRRLTSKAFGESEPLLPNTSTANKAKNRRVVAKLIVNP